MRLLSTLLCVSWVVSNNGDNGSTCTVGVDGTCVNDEPVQNPNSNDKAAAQPWQDLELPVMNPNGYVDIGYGEKQLVQGDEIAKTRSKLQEMLFYMRETVAKDPAYNGLRRECLNRNELCAFWAAIGECEVNPKYMQLNCAPACLSCEQLSFETRCPFPKEMQDERIWQRGDLDGMFERIVRDYGDNVTILAQPGHPLTADGMNPPWVITIDNFLTPLECETLIQLGADKGYEISKDVGKRKFDGTYDAKQSQGRTSTNTWCTDECYQHEITQGILQKMHDLTGIPDSHGEYLQLLRYEEGQFYEEHHDYIQHHLRRSMGVRILTVFLYLNNVPQGGGTRFTDLDIVSPAIQGRALLWPSVKNLKPDNKDARTHHEAMPVIEGIKYGANAWYHQRDFKTPYAANCI